MSVVNFGHDLEKKNRDITGLLPGCGWYKNIIQTAVE